MLQRLKRLIKKFMHVFILILMMTIAMTMQKKINLLNQLNLTHQKLKAQVHQVVIKVQAESHLLGTDFYRLM